MISSQSPCIDKNDDRKKKRTRTTMGLVDSTFPPPLGNASVMAPIATAASGSFSSAPFVKSESDMQLYPKQSYNQARGFGQVCCSSHPLHDFRRSFQLGTLFLSYPFPCIEIGWRTGICQSATTTSASSAASNVAAAAAAAAS